MGSHCDMALTLLDGGWLHQDLLIVVFNQSMSAINLDAFDVMLKILVVFAKKVLAVQLLLFKMEGILHLSAVTTALDVGKAKEVVFEIRNV